MNAPSPSGQPVGFAIIGLGMIAEFHARAIAHTPGARLVGVASRDRDKAKAFAALRGPDCVGGTLKEVLARSDVDAVCITTPSGAHLEPALAAIRAGKHVVIEKPIEITPARADEILRAADAAQVKLAPIFQARFGPGARALKAAIDAGRFGRLTLASAYVKWHRAPAYYTGWKGTLSLDGGGALINQAIHAVDLLQWFAGLPEEVFAWKTRRVHTAIEAEDTVVAALRFGHGALGTLEASTAAYPGLARRLEICGENGSARLDDDQLVQWQFRDSRPEDAAILAAKADPAMQSGAGAANAISFAGHQRQIEDLVAAIREKRAPAIDGREARKAVALVRAIYDSAELGQPVRLV